MKLSALAAIAIIGLAGSVHAQSTSASSAQPPSTQAPASDAPASSATSSSSAAPAASASPSAAKVEAPAGPPPPSEDFLKEARVAGYHPKVKNGVYSFCKSDADTGTRFVTEHCYNEATMASILERAQTQRDEMRHGMGCGGGGTCGSK